MASFDKVTQVDLRLFFFLLMIVTGFPLASHGCRDDDRSALLEFKSSLSDPSNRLSSWQQHENCCDWHGIRCSNVSSHVVSIDLRNKDLENYIQEFDHYNDDVFDPPSTVLRGEFSTALLKLTHLEYLDLSYNNFQESQFPRQFSQLTSLTHLDLSYTNFASSISTQFTNTSSLQFLDLSCTSDIFSASCLQTSSAKWVRGLGNLKILRLSGIDLHGATSSEDDFGKHISHVAKLRELDLSYCNVASPVFTIHNLSRLSSLKMDHNSELDSFPVELVNLTTLSMLNLAYCNLHGSVPYLPQLKELTVSGNHYLRVDLTSMFMNRWPKLRKLRMSSTVANKFIPSSISNAPLLSYLTARGCSIQGSLPSSFYNLTHLQYLDISWNSITGSIHHSISNLKSLYYLDLSSNYFQGSIPKSICECLPLETLRLDYNNITGTPPSCISQHQNLRHFAVAGNFIEGNVSLFSLISENLITLDMGFNRQLNLDMRFHSDQHSLYPKLSLEYLRLRSCNLEGSFPISLCKLSNLEVLDVSDNSLTGTIPSCVFKLKHLNEIHVPRNQLHGPVPLPPQGIHSFDLSSNKFSGEIPLKLGRRLFNAFAVSLAGNELSGSIPSSLFPTEPGFTSIENIDLSNNTLTGTIPYNIGYCSSLRSLKLGNNNLTGKVPDELKLAKHVKFLQLNNNHLGGTPLNLIDELHEMEFLFLANNNFEGTIPAGLGSLQYLRFLSLRSNKFNGSIPEEIIHLQRLQLLDLSLNNLSGSIPNKLGNLSGLISSSYLEDRNYGDVQLEVATKGNTIQIDQLNDYTSAIDLSCNHLHGNIPKEIGLLALLSSLNLSHNHFDNDIPESIGNLSGLQSLDLSSNRLSGHIPQSLATIDTLSVLNLSSNKLSGQVPRSPHFDTLSVDGSAFSGNELLCGYPTNKRCGGDRDTSTSDANSTNEVDQDDAKDKLLLYAMVSLGFIVGFWGLFFVLLLNKQKWWFPYWKYVDWIVVRIMDCIQNYR